uniref:Uncharacterized protein n=1 Tax=Cucumis melo TaxID=3656 RepID=A0A9I9EEL7_CUCME
MVMATYDDLVMQNKRLDFPNHFFFGTSTSSYQGFNFNILCLQIEGGYVEDGRGKVTMNESISLTEALKNFQVLEDEASLSNKTVGHSPFDGPVSKH